MDNRNGITQSTRRRESIAPEPADGVHTDLHISLLPKNFWNGELNCAPYQSVADAVTIGFVRCHCNSSVIALREEIAAQLIDDKNLPNSYIFLKGVGRALVPIRPKQETMLTIENFKAIGSRMPPEIILLDAQNLGQSHSARMQMPGSKTRLLPRRPSEVYHQENDSSSLENATDLRDRVNKGVRQRMQSRTKPGKPSPPAPKIQKNPDMKRGQTHDGVTSEQTTPRDPRNFRKKNNELNRVNHEPNSSGVSTNKKTVPNNQEPRRKGSTSVRFPPVDALEHHNYPSEAETAHDSTPRNFPLAQPSRNGKPLASKSNKSKLSNIPRRVHVMGETSDSDESMVVVRRSTVSKYAAPDKVTKNQKPPARASNNSKRSVTNKSHITGKVSAPSPRSKKAGYTTNTATKQADSDVIKRPDSDSEDEGFSSGHYGNRVTKLKAQRQSSSNKSKKSSLIGRAGDGGAVTSSDGYTSNPALPPIKKSKDRGSYVQQHSEKQANPEEDRSEPHRVESFEEFYRRKSSIRTDSLGIGNSQGEKCPDCGQHFKEPIDAKRHFNLIHRTSRATIEARKRVSALKTRREPSRFGNVTGLMK